MEITISTKTLKIIAAIVASVIVILVVQGIIQSKNAQTNCDQSVCGVENTNTQEEKILADKIEVIHFHATQQCWSCITIADFAEKTLRSRFQGELDNGKIVFQSINIDSPENKEIVEKYGATGSSLFVNYIYDGKDHIAEDVQVWSLVNNQTQFEKYLGDKLAKYL
jgi:hypothetical protein